MAHDSVINTFIHVGLRQKELQNVLATNVVLDWFGRTLSGKQRVVDFYLNSNNIYEHHLKNTESTQPFESRSTHMITRKHPEENFDKSIDLSGEEQWFDCEAHTSVDLKESQKTPPKKPTVPNCPPAPCRRVVINNSSDEEVDISSEDDSELGVFPLDSSIDVESSNKKKREQNAKRQRIEGETNDINGSVAEKSTLERESNYSELYYLESTVTVITKRQASSSMSRSEDNDRRESKLLISYRINKTDQNDVQIALIVYKSNNINQKSRRNLMNEFGSEEISETDTSMAATSRFSTVVKENPKKLDNTLGIATEPIGNKSLKGIKRPMQSRNRLRF